MRIGLGMSLGQVSGATGKIYYVDPAGSDANSGLSPVTPWQTIAKVNSSTFQPGDSVLLKRGGTWHEMLSIPSSGSTARKIKFGAYGNGNNPLLKGSVALTNGNFGSYGIGPIPIFSQTVTTNNADGATRNYRQVLTGITEPASQIQVQLTASDTVDWVIVGASIGVQSAGNAATSLTRITWNSGANGVTITHGTSKTSDTINFNVAPGVTYLVHVYMSARGMKFGAPAGPFAYYDANVSDETLVTAPTGGQLNSNVPTTQIVTAVIKPTETIWKATQATNPVEVWESGNFLANAASAATCTAGSWYWDGANLYLNPSDNSNITTNGRLYEVCSWGLLSSILDNGHSYLEIANIDCTQTYGATDVTGMSGIVLTGSNNVVRDLTTWGHRRHCISCYTGAKNNLIYNVTAYDCESTTPIAIYGGGAPGQTINNLVRNCNVYQANANCAKDGAVVFHGMASNNTLEFCDLHTDVTSVMQVVNLMDAGTDGNIVQFNHIRGNSSNAIISNGATNVSVIGNLIEGFGSHLIFFKNTASGTIYNNTIVPGTSTGYGIYVINTALAVTAKNNILYGAKSIWIADATSQALFIADYNSYYYSGGAGVTFNLLGVTKTYAQWQGIPFDTHAVNSDPKFTNAPTDYSLQASSPCIGAGVTLATANVLNLLTTFPAYVLLSPQTSPWSLGAYAHH